MLGKFLMGEVEFWLTGGQGWDPEAKSGTAVADRPQQDYQPRKLQDLSNLRDLRPVQPEQVRQPVYQYDKDYDNEPGLEVIVPKQYEGAIQACLDGVAECMDWDDVERDVAKVVYEPDNPMFHTVDRNYTQMNSDGSGMRMRTQAATAGIPGEKHRICVGDTFFDLPPNNQIFAMLHEIRHCQLRHGNQHPSDPNEEEDWCDQFADQSMRRAGIPHTYNSAFQNGFSLR